MAPSKEELLKIAEEAERDINKYENKFGIRKIPPGDDAPIDTSVEKKFPGAKVSIGIDVHDPGGYRKRDLLEEEAAEARRR
jgi:hypothetical protein